MISEDFLNKRGGGTVPRIMPARFVTVDRQTAMFLSCDLRDGLPAEHIVHFILDAVERLPLHHFPSMPAAPAARSIRR